MYLLTRINVLPSFLASYKECSFMDTLPESLPLTAKLAQEMAV
jgi:hypothetical protein